MGSFSKEKAKNTKPVDYIEAVLVIPELYIEDGAVIELHIRPSQVADTERVRKAFFAKKDEDRALDYNELARDVICSMLVKEPKGADEFPTDDRHLTDRAIEYFSTGMDDDLQSFINEKFGEIWERHQGVVNPTPYFRRAANPDPKQLADGGGDGETAAG